MLPETLPRPPSVDDGSGKGPEMWVDEQIWGHRLHDEQTPWLGFLEFLTVLRSQCAAGRGLQETVPNTLEYTPRHLLHLRNILFNNPKLLAIAKQFTDEDGRWTEWLRTMSATADGLGDDPDFVYVRQRFAQFDDFVDMVKLLRSTAIEGDSNKRWSSKFVFPYGPDALYEDLNVKPNSLTNDRRFFGRVGELAYLMLARSGHGQELLELLKPIVINERSPWDRLVKAFSPSEPEAAPRRKNAYLPYASLPTFKVFAEDWLAILRCGMPGYDALPHLVDTFGLHILEYMLRQGQTWIDPKMPVRLVLEIIAPKRTTVRDLACESYLENNHLSRNAIVHALKHLVDESPEWQVALASADPVGNAVRVTQKIVAWPDDDEIKGIASPDELRRGLEASAMRRHVQHVANVHARYAGAIGLASRRGTRRLRYAPSDRLLRSLVLASVPVRMEFQRFLQVLCEKYCFVIGHRQAQCYIDSGQSDQKAFQDNARRLEQRLESLGLLTRLSDACAYVINPFAAGATA